MPILDGKKLAKERKAQLQKQVDELKAKTGRVPHLTVILVGEDAASEVYVGHKEKQCAEAGIKSTIVRLSKDISVSDLKKKIEELNQNKEVDGILVQLPLPPALKDFDPSDSIDPQKDVDGLTATNMGLMIKNRAYAEPCTPKGIVTLLKENNIEIAGKKVVVLGRSQIVGWPMAWMLTRENATVTVCHSKTKNLNEVIRMADIVVVAIGKPHFLNKENFKENAVVVDVGIHRSREGKLLGDVDTEGFAEKNIMYSPVPGGVGPMTVSQLLENQIELFKKRSV